MKTIVLAGGGSGGHIVPLLPLARALKAKDPGCRVIYAGVKGEKLEGLEGRYSVFDDVFYVAAGKLRRYHGQSFWQRLVDVKSWLLNLRDILRLIIGSFTAWHRLGRIKPAVVFSKGGYGALPVGLAARCRKIPIVTHDSDSLPGLANRIIGRWAAIHATGQPSENYESVYAKGTIRYVGIPLDDRIKPADETTQARAKTWLGLPADSFVLTVAGGSLGSATINNKVLTLSPDFLKSQDKNYILHFSGTAHETKVRSAYQKALSPTEFKRVKIIGFSSDYYKYTEAADVVVARAGASTLAELAAQRKACIILPAEFLSGGHQSQNAKNLQAKNAAIISHDGLSPKKLLDLINQLKLNPQRRKQLGEKIGSLARPHAAQDLAGLILDNAKFV